jgi:signal transduction histidine kinase
METNNELMSIFWHESKSPLSSIHGLSELFAKGDLPEPEKKHFSNIEQNAKKIIDYISEMSNSSYNVNQEKQEEIQENYWKNVNKYLSSIKSDFEELKNYELPEEIKRIVPNLLLSLEKIEKFYGLHELKNISKKELIKNSKIINLEEILKDSINGFEKDLTGNNLTINQTYQGNLNLSAHTASVYTLFTTLLGNSMKYTPKEDCIDLILKDNSESINIELKNSYTEKPRCLHGTGQGLGIPYSRKIVKNMGGKMLTCKNKKIHRVKIILPKNLTQLNHQ